MLTGNNKNGGIKEMGIKIGLDKLFCFVAIEVVFGAALIFGLPFKCEAAPDIYDGDSVRVTIKGYVPAAQRLT